MKSLDQVRAGRAFSAVEALGSSEDFDRARGLPMMLLQNGLLATWAFLLAKSKAGSSPLLSVFLDHFRASSTLSGWVGDGPADRVFRQWVEPVEKGGLDGPGLRRLTAEAVELAGWIKRAVEARPESPKSGSSTDA